jgi:hypothetical protein
MNITIPTPLREKVEALIGVLDVDVQHLTASLAHLDALRSLVIKRDEAGLNDLLDAIRSDSTGYQGNEHKRQYLRQDLADLMGCSLGELTLSCLEQCLPDPWPRALAERKQVLRELTSQVRQEHMRTSWLLRDCARLNGLILDALMNPGRDTTLTYSGTGKTQQHRENSLMNLQF